MTKNIVIMITHSVIVGVILGVFAGMWFAQHSGDAAYQKQISTFALARVHDLEVEMETMVRVPRGYIGITNETDSTIVFPPTSRHGYSVRPRESLFLQPDLYYAAFRRTRP